MIEITINMTLRWNLLPKKPRDLRDRARKSCILAMVAIIQNNREDENGDVDVE
jgi:hypothetical protein